jgi:hypothetical protein
MCKVKVASSSENTPFSEKTFVQGPDAPLHIRNNESTSYTHQSDRELPANPNMHLHAQCYFRQNTEFSKTKALSFCSSKTN